MGCAAVLVVVVFEPLQVLFPLGTEYLALLDELRYVLAAVLDQSPLGCRLAVVVPRQVVPFTVLYKEFWEHLIQNIHLVSWYLCLYAGHARIKRFLGCFPSAVWCAPHKGLELRLIARFVLAVGHFPEVRIAHVVWISNGTCLGYQKLKLIAIDSTEG